ncbi:MAG: hypothetical protein ABIJ50_13680, partial [Pseudomonadota bacterium]
VHTLFHFGFIKWKRIWTQQTSEAECGRKQNYLCNDAKKSDIFIDNDRYWPQRGLKDNFLCFS